MLIAGKVKSLNYKAAIEHLIEKGREGFKDAERKHSAALEENPFEAAVLGGIMGAHEWYIRELELLLEAAELVEKEQKE